MRARTAVPCLSRELDVLACTFDGASVGRMSSAVTHETRRESGRKRRTNDSIFGDLDLNFKTKVP